MHNLPSEARNDIIRNYREYRKALRAAIATGGLRCPEVRAILREHATTASIYRELKDAERR